ncbi:unnamed protein product [Caretta caretta]
MRRGWREETGAEPHASRQPWESGSASAPATIYTGITRIQIKKKDHKGWQSSRNDRGQQQASKTASSSPQL